MSSSPPYPLRFLSAPPTNRAPSPVPVYSTADDDDSSSDQDDATKLSRRSSYFLLPRAPSFTGSVSALTSSVSPYGSRPGSPLPPLYASTSEDDHEPSSPLLLSTSSSSGGATFTSFKKNRRWWPRSTKRKHDASLRGLKRKGSKILRHPLFPTKPITILLSLLLFTTFALLLTLSLIYILNPDKYALPWRDYCANTPETFPPDNFESLPPAGVFLGVFSMDAAVERRMLIRTTYASHVRSRGLDAATDRTVLRFILGKPKREWERRIQLEMQMYNDIVILPVTENMNNGKTHAFFVWAHENALVPPPFTNHTSNPVHRLPAPPKPVPVPPKPIPPPPTSISTVSTATPVEETAAPTGTTESTVAPEAEASAEPEPHLPTMIVRRSSVSPLTGLAPAIRPMHDPRPRSTQSKSLKHHKRQVQQQQRETWVRPDFIAKADDDSFVMLAELEARLRVEWDLAMKAPPMPGVDITSDPMIFWGYLVKSRFMAGELYALSASLVQYIATSSTVKGMITGAEDKQTSKWIRNHPQADQVRWRSEHCWMYDHPRSGTVYSHGFLFPSEVGRVRQQVKVDREVKANATSSASSSGSFGWSGIASSTGGSNANGGSAPSWGDDDKYKGNWTPGPPNPWTPRPEASTFLSQSSVTRFGTRYALPIGNLTLPMQVEALVEGSALSSIRRTALPESGSSSSDSGNVTPTWTQIEKAWDSRETYEERFAPSSAIIRRQRGASNGSFFGKRGIGLGGTVVVHFIKKNEWFLEASLALLGPSINGDDGRIDSGARDVVVEDEPVTSVVAKTQSFKRRDEEQDVEDVAAEPLAESPTVQPLSDPSVDNTTPA
ncbi:hypothetical protein FRB98_003576 [Tulasnella sp. 332]|nr:hypothetical protein FRB98_003576 [Tulasnella sp. 332]